MHTCVHAYICKWIHICMKICNHAYKHTCKHTHMHACIHGYMYTCIHAYIHTFIHAFCFHSLPLAKRLEKDDGRTEYKKHYTLTETVQTKDWEQPPANWQPAASFLGRELDSILEVWGATHLWRTEGPSGLTRGL